jgi:glycosyltransferase involved in cell wall biosynthesis
MRRSLYLSHTGLTEPLGRSQVVPYLEGLARAGWRIEVVAFEPATASAAEIARLVDELAARGIGYRWTRRRASPRLGVKVRESARAFVALVGRALAARPRIVHARSYLPGAVAQAVARLVPGARFLFDCRGLLGDEYADGGYWSRGSFRYRLLKRFERRLFGRADGVVTLTDRLRRWLRDSALVGPDTPVEVIPCCVDLARFSVDARARAAARAALGAGERLVLAYAGSLGSWYCEEEMARLFAAVRRRRPSLFAVYSRAPTERLRAALAQQGVPDEDVAVRPTAPADMPAALAAADAAISFARPWFSKIASSPVKVAEYLACGVPVVLNRGIGDQDDLFTSAAVIDAGELGADDLERAAERVCALRPVADEARRVARARFALDEIGVARYCRLYEQLAG